jgi:hypothetical protein
MSDFMLYWQSWGDTKAENIYYMALYQKCLPTPALEKIICCNLNSDFPPLTVLMKLQIKYPLSKMLGTRSVTDFRSFLILEYLYIHNRNLGKGPKSKQRIHLYFICALYTWPGSNIIQYCNSFIHAWHKASQCGNSQLWHDVGS